MKTVAYAKFTLGQMVEHKFLAYRGLIVDLDAEFDSSVLSATNVEAPTENLDMPWYHILVEGERYAAYIAEDNLQAVTAKHTAGFKHPMLSDFFKKAPTGTIAMRHSIN